MLSLSSTARSRAARPLYRRASTGTTSSSSFAGSANRSLDSASNAAMCASKADGETADERADEGANEDAAAGADEGADEGADTTAGAERDGNDPGAMGAGCSITADVRGNGPVLPSASAT